MPRLKRFTRAISIWIPVELKEKIREMARARGISMAQIVREALDEQLRRLEKNDDEAEKLGEELRTSREF